MAVIKMRRCRGRFVRPVEGDRTGLTAVPFGRRRIMRIWNEKKMRAERRVAAASGFVGGVAGLW